MLFWFDSLVCFKFLMICQLNLIIITIYHKWRYSNKIYKCGNRLVKKIKERIVWFLIFKSNFLFLKKGDPIAWGAFSSWKICILQSIGQENSLHLTDCRLRSLWTIRRREVIKQRMVRFQFHLEASKPKTQQLPERHSYKRLEPGVKTQQHFLSCFSLLFFSHPATALILLYLYLFFFFQRQLQWGKWARFSFITGISPGFLF